MNSLIILADSGWQNQYTDTGWFAVAATLLVCFYVLFNIYRSGQMDARGKSLYIRRIQGLNAIDEAVGRATEMGRPVLMIPGIGGIGPVVVQALNIFSHITRIAGKFANPILLCCADAAVFTVAQETIRDVYQTEGIPDLCDPDAVRFISDRQFAFASGISGIILREKVAAAFMMGDFFAESLIFAETANMVGAIQIASSTQTTQTPFFIACCDYVLIGDEFYAASAYLSRQPVLTGSLVGQDWSKISLGLLILMGSIWTCLNLGIGSANTTSQVKANGSWTLQVPPKTTTSHDTTMWYLFHPQEDPSLKNTIHRELLTPEPTAADANQPATGGAN